MPNNVVIKPGAVVEYASTELSGEITIDKGTVVHLGVHIIAEGGPIIIGANNLFEEGVVIHNKPAADGTLVIMRIGDSNVFEIRSYSEALNIGSHNVIQMRAQLLEGVTLGDGCVVGVDMTLADLQVKDRTHYYKHNDVVQQRHSNDLPQAQTQQLEYLRNMLPNYHKIRKPTKVEGS